jgi:hypothetical protein
LRLLELGGLIAADMTVAAVVPMGEAQSVEFTIPIYFRVERQITGKWPSAALSRVSSLDLVIAVRFYVRSEFT